MSFNFSEAEITRFRNLSAANKAAVIDKIFEGEVMDATKRARYLNAFLNAENICQHKKQQIKNALTALGL